MGMTLIPKRKIQNISQVKELTSHITQNVTLEFPQDRIITVNDGNPVLELKQVGSGKGLFVNMDGAGVGLEIDSAAPEQRLTENDQTDPAGRWRKRVAGDVFYIERAKTASWATIWNFIYFALTGGVPTVYIRDENSTVDVQTGHKTYPTRFRPWSASHATAIEPVVQFYTLNTTSGLCSLPVLSICNKGTTGVLRLDYAALQKDVALRGIKQDGVTLLPLFILNTDDQLDIFQQIGLRFYADTTLTIVSGVVTRATDKGYHTIAAETGTTDNLDTINGGSEGDFLVIQPDTGDTITVKHGTGNISLFGTADIAISGTQKLLLFYDGSNWVNP